MSSRKLNGQDKARKNAKMLRMPEKAEAEQEAEGPQNCAELGAEKPRFEGKPKRALRKAVKSHVEKESTKIAASIVHQVNQGDMRGAEVVLSVLQKAKEEDAKRKAVGEGPSWAQLLASEPEWDESMEARGEGTECKLAS